MEMSRGKVEIVSRLARWRPGRVDTLGPWQNRSDNRSYCWSDSFKMGISEWSIGISKHKDNPLLVRFALLYKHSPFLKQQPIVAKLMFRVFDVNSGDSPHHSSNRFVLKPNESSNDSKEHTLNDFFVVDVEFLDLEITPLSHREQSPSVWPIEGTTRYLATEIALSCLPSILKDEIYTDVIINTLDGTLKAHKAILSGNSPVFKSMFLHDLKEKETSTISIEDMTFESCKALLYCMHGAIKEEEFFEQRLALLVAADKYGMTELKNCCEGSLLMDVNSSNVFERLQEAWIHRLDKLKKVCFKYLFGLGMVFKVKDEMNSFIHHADRELIQEMFQEMTTAENPGYI